MKQREAIRVLLRCAENDVRGSGMGFRSTSDAWRDKVSEAWLVIWTKAYHRPPSENEIHNAGMCTIHAKKC